MEAPILQITVLEGPRNGEILVWKPQSTIRIGRVKKGNDVALRDPGISQKHLCFRFIQEDSRWFVSDLDTCNGTILNGSQIRASVPVPVSDGDVLLIGEKTKLGVKIVTPRVLEEKEEGDNVRGRRVTRRGSSLRVRTRASSSRVSDEEAGLKEAQSRDPALVSGQMNNARPISAKISSEEEKKEETLNPCLVSDSGVEMGNKKKRRVRGISARVFEEERDESSYPETKESDQNREVKLRRNPSRGNSSGVLKELDANCKVESDLQGKEVGVKRKGRGKASTSSLKERENDENLNLEIGSESSDPNYVAIPEIRKAIKAKNSANSSMVIEEKEEEEGVGVGVGVEGAEINSEEARVDFENMTLDEWFDTMEVFLPKVIYEESEKVIGILKEKARKLDELLEAGIDAV